MKRILFLFSFLLFIFLTPTAFAQQQQNVVLPKSETVNRDYFATGNQVQILGTVNGDAYVGGGTVIVTGDINGDLLVAGGNVTISGIIKNDVRAAGGNVTLSDATVGGNVTALGGQVTITSSSKIEGSLVSGTGNLQVLGPVGKGATFGAGQAILGSSIGGDVLAGTGQLSLSPNSSINGNLTYFSNEKAQIGEGTKISGKTEQKIPPKQLQKQETGRNVAKAAEGAFLIFKFIDILSTLILGLILIAFLPVYMDNAGGYIRQHFWASFFTGLIALIIIPVIAVILMIIVIGIPLGIILLVSYAVLIWFAKIFSIYALGQVVLNWAKNKAARGWAFAAGLVIYLILTFIPIVNAITGIVILFTGIGSFLAMKRQYYTNLRAKKTI